MRPRDRFTQILLVRPEKWALQMNMLTDTGAVEVE